MNVLPNIPTFLDLGLYLTMNTDRSLVTVWSVWISFCFSSGDTFDMNKLKCEKINQEFYFD